MSNLTRRSARRPTRGQLQCGIALLESLVALLILAVGVLGLLGVQIRTLADTQTGVRRAQAVRVIEDLGERLKANPAGFARLSDYAVGWGAAAATAPSPDCSTAACTPTELAARDVWEWKTSLAQQLPGGDAIVFLSPDEATDNQRQLGVMVGWRANERQGLVRFDVDVAAVTAATCPENLICHIVYVQP